MKIYAYLAAFLAFIGLLWGAVNYGQLIERNKATKAVIAYQEREVKLLDKLEKAKAKREVIYRDRIKIVRKATDSSGCLDTRLPADVLNGLRNDSLSSR